MKYDVYCDESRQDLLVNKESIRPNNKYCCIGGLMIPQSLRDEIKNRIKLLKEKYNLNGEIKWSTVSTNKIDFYLELVDLFFEFDELNFRTIVIDASVVDNSQFNLGDHELGYYKFYYQLLFHWLSEADDYCIFTDFKTNKQKNRLHELKRIINCHFPDQGNVQIIQAINSKESLLLQLENIIMGAVGYKFNFSEGGSSAAKRQVVSRVEKHLGHEIMQTNSQVKKFNVFKIILQKEVF